VTPTDEPLPGAPADETPPPDDSTLWLVSFGETDDREMRAPEIAAALRRGEIKSDTIVWREGLSDWVSIANVPLLARLLPSTGETQGAPAVIGKVPLVRREEPRPETQSSSAIATPSSAATPIFGMRGAVGNSAATTLQGTGGSQATNRIVETGIRTTEEKSGEPAAAMPAWKGRTRMGIGFPRMESGAKPAADAAAKPDATAAAQADATATPSPTAPTASAGEGAQAKAQAAPQPTAKAATESAKGALEPQRPEPRKIEPKAFGATPKTPTASAPRVVPKAAPAPTLKTAETKSSPVATEVKSSPKAAPASSPASTDVSKSSPTATGSSPVAADVPASPMAPPAAVASEQAPAAAVAPPPAATATPFPNAGKPASATATPHPEAGKPSPQVSRKPEPAKGPPPRHREGAAARPAAQKTDTSRTAGRTGAANIWEDDEPGPISVDPESVRPPPPAHAIAEARAQSIGPGLRKKATPRPPSPKKTPAPPASAPAPETDDPTVPLPVATSVPAKAPVISSLEVPLVSEFSEPPPPVDLTPTVPREPKTSPSTSPAASQPPAPEKRRSLFPYVLLAATLSVVTIFVLRNRAPSEPVTATQEPVTTVAPPEPKAETPAEPPAPAAPETSAATEPTPPPVASAPSSPPVEKAQPAAGTKPNNATTEVATSTPAAPKEPKPEAKPGSQPAPKEPKKPEPVAAAVPEGKQVDDVGGEFDREAAVAALSSAASAASGCRKEGDPSGVAIVHVTFSNAGRATRAVVEGPPFAGTATGGCIAEMLRKAKVPPFGGDRVTVTKRVVIQ
jgi:hypothetical protein